MLLREAEAAAAQTGSAMEQASFLAPLLQGVLRVPRHCVLLNYRERHLARQTHKARTSGHQILPLQSNTTLKPQPFILVHCLHLEASNMKAAEQVSGPKNSISMYFTECVQTGFCLVDFLRLTSPAPV